VGEKSELNYFHLSLSDEKGACLKTCNVGSIGMIGKQASQDIVQL